MGILNDLIHQKCCAMCTEDFHESQSPVEMNGDLVCVGCAFDLEEAFVERGKRLYTMEPPDDCFVGVGE